MDQRTIATELLGWTGEDARPSTKLGVPASIVVYCPRTGVSALHDSWSEFAGRNALATRDLGVHWLPFYMG
jgi:hypothetical protein